ncbi:MAG: hypothetical protein Hyperionvirus1_102 [Hyperionvirus sp.]|uniref:Uncharacterized protein n=1 Tax=Hyperionvirus sp. TaxID=2487770 RepID=A0A3G5A9K9_9VIRU|nr:MAG: hypothetical protein Hyperionvirus1_102 [Hyperionvirus sp.]
MDDSKILRTLLVHERELLKSGKIGNLTHKGATSAWLDAPSSVAENGMTTVYRVMGDAEFLYLLEKNELPDTQPYQAIMEGPRGRVYAEKYLNGKKYVNTSPTTVVEFLCPENLITELFKIQHKAEDGALSIGLGNKAGNGLKKFNESLTIGNTKWKIVKVKRPLF